MPQLDKFSFGPQVFWFFLLFIITYYVITFHFLPRIATSLKVRTKMLNLLHRELKELENLENKIGEQYKYDRRRMANGLYLIVGHFVNVCDFQMENVEKAVSHLTLNQEKFKKIDEFSTRNIK